jgi:hypothetical protein
LSCTRQFTVGRPDAICALIEVAALESFWGSGARRNSARIREQFEKLYGKLAAMSDACNAAFGVVSKRRVRRST